MRYRNIEYTPRMNKDRTWRFSCSDENLLKGTELTMFTTVYKEDMEDKIDDYLDNREDYVKIKTMIKKACGEYMNLIPLKTK